MNPPFLFFAKKRNGPFTVQREIAWAQNGTLCLFLLQYGGRARRCSKNLIGFYRVRRTSAEQRWYFPAFGGLGAAFGVVVGFGPSWPRAFRFATRYHSLSPRGESKGEGPQPLPFEPLQGGVGETGEAPPAADEARLFRGGGAIGGPERGRGIAMPRRC